jgi:hypothetical protein
MYRSTAKKAKRASVWALTAALSVGAGLGAANLATLGSHLTAASATSATVPTKSTVATTAPVTTAPAATATVASSSTAPVVRTAALTTAPTPRTVLAVSASSITVRSSSGAIATYKLSASTVYLSGTTHVSVASVHPGGQVIVVPSSTNPTYAAVVGILPSRGEHESESSQGGSDN